MRSLSQSFCLLALGLTPVLSLAALTNGKLQVGIVKDEAYLYDKQGKKEPLKTARIFQEGFRVETTPKNTVELILSNGSTLIVSPDTLLEVKTFRQVVSDRIVEGEYQKLDKEPSPSITEIEVIRAESGVGRTLEQIIVADSNLRIRQRALKRLMNRGDLPVSSATPLKPASDPNPMGLTLDGGVLSEQAVANRMEMLELELQLSIDATNVDLQRNAALLELQQLFALQSAFGLHLAISGDKCSEESAKANHHKPVCDSSSSEVEHLGMAQNFFEHIFHAGRFIAAASWVWLLLLI